MKISLVYKGGAGSGHKHHAGRPGQRGGSLPGSSIATPVADTSKYVRAENSLREYLHNVHSMSENSMESIVLRHGRSFTPQPLPKGIRMGKAKECFMNAYHLSQKDGMHYVEGYAYPDFMDLPIQHAWCVDSEGKVYDNTWKTHGNAYIGIRFDPEFVASVISETGTYGVMDFTSSIFRDKYWRKK